MGGERILDRDVLPPTPSPMSLRPLILLHFEPMLYPRDPLSLSLSFVLPFFLKIRAKKKLRNEVFVEMKREI